MRQVELNGRTLHGLVFDTTQSIAQVILEDKTIIPMKEQHSRKELDGTSTIDLGGTSQPNYRTVIYHVLLSNVNIYHTVFRDDAYITDISFHEIEHENNDEKNEEKIYKGLWIIKFSDGQQQEVPVNMEVIQKHINIFQTTLRRNNDGYITNINVIIERKRVEEVEVDSMWIIIIIILGVILGIFLFSIVGVLVYRHYNKTPIILEGDKKLNNLNQD